MLFAIGLVVYGLFAWNRLGHRSNAPQYVFQADAWLHGQLSIDPPLVDADWAKIETVALDDGSEVRGRRMTTRPAVFRTLDGEEIATTRIKQSRAVTWYMSFPPLPTLLMLPSAAISGRDGNDVIPTLLVAALILPLAFALLRRLAEAKLSERTPREDLWLVAALAFGSVLFFSAVGGRVWYTAQVVGVALALVYARASVEARRPILAGIALGAAALTRPPIAFMFPLFVLEAWRVSGGDRRAFGRTLGRFAAPVVAFAIAGMAYNYVRFDSPTEFGHTFLFVRQQTQIEQWGLANYHYLARNLAVAFTLLPELPGHAPWIRIGGHGLAMWVTTPLLLFVLWPRTKPAIHRTLWIAVACVALPDFLYMNTGWVQFGYRFSLDFLPLLFALVAVGGRPLGRVGKALIAIGIVVNTFGAITFDRYAEYYRTEGSAYDVVVPD